MTVEIRGVNENVRAESPTKNKGSTKEFLEIYSKVMLDLLYLADAAINN